MKPVTILLKPVNMGTIIAWCITMNHVLPFRHFDILDERIQIIANGLRKTGGMHRNNLWIIYIKNVLGGSFKLEPPPTRCTFGKGAGRSHCRVFKMSG